MRGGTDEADPNYGVIDREEEQMRVSPENARQRDLSPASETEPGVMEHNVSYNISVTSLLRVEEMPAGSSPPPPSPLSVLF
ncbi:hypothetical protein J437_LFUL018316 [Ladona fulva]|uniref:Uncharacterized protein n=1 Tax=Ladona fulva TaxID=123851 RepID=A0A8K0KQ44_LADFU|nr:hypothetical protein J437_LFUL018316 [Ladona fulva]